MAAPTTSPAPAEAPAAAPAPTRRRPSRLVVMALAALAVLAGAELAARATASRFEPPLTFYSQEADTKVARMDELAAAGGADVVFFGTSQVGWGIRPDLVEQHLGMTAYNASLGGATPTIMEPWALEVVLPRLQPEVVVIGVSSLDLQDSEISRDRTRQFLDSDGVRRATGRDSLLDRADHWVAERSVFWERRGALRDPSAWKTAVQGGYELPPFVQSIDRWGYNRIGQDFTFEERPLTGPGVRGWRLGQDNREALARLVRGAQATGARVLLVEMPVTEAFVQRHPRGAADYRHFQEVVAGLAGANGATVLRYQHGDLRSFGDLIHLNGLGAQTFSAQLARDIAGIVPGLVPPATADVAGGDPDDIAAPGVPEVADALPGAVTPTVPTVPEAPAVPDAGSPPPVVAPAITLPPVPAVTIPDLPEVPGDLPGSPVEGQVDVPVAGG